MDILAIDEAAADAAARFSRKSRSRLPGVLPAPMCAGRRFRPSTFSSVTDVTHQRIYQLYTDASLVRLVFQNLAMQGTPNENSAGTFTIKVAVVWDHGKAQPIVVPVTFGGVRTRTVAQYETVVSDPIDVSFLTTPGEYFAVHTYVTTAGAFVPVSSWDTQLVGGLNEGYLTGDFTDVNNSFGGAPNKLGGISFGPVAICGWATDGLDRTVYQSGDSIPSGSNWGSMEAPSDFISYKLNANRIPTIAGTRSGELLSTVRQYAQTFQRMNLVHGIPYAIDEYGTNDIGSGRTTTQVKADLLAHWAVLARRGMIVHRTTISPRTNSTDGWMTPGAQTTYGGAAQELVRQQINQWLRAPRSAGAGNSALFDAASTLTFVHDSAAKVEQNADGSMIAINPATGAISNGSGGLWKTDSTALASGTVTAIPAASKLQDTTKTWSVGQWIGYRVGIISDPTTPAAVGQSKMIAGNTVDTLNFDTGWTTTPSTAATYRIYKPFADDGIHPTGFGHKEMSLGIDHTQFPGV